MADITMAERGAGFRICACERNALAVGIENQAGAHPAMLVGMNGLDEILTAAGSDPLVGDIHMPDWRPTVIGHQTPRKLSD